MAGVENIKNGEPFTVFVPRVVRWKAYKPGSHPAFMAKWGVWQERDEYGGWHNFNYDPETSLNSNDFINLLDALKAAHVLLKLKTPVDDEISQHQILKLRQIIEKAGGS